MKLMPHRMFSCALLAVALGTSLWGQDAGPMPATPQAASDLEYAHPKQATQSSAAPAAAAAVPAVQPSADSKAPARIEVPTGTHIPLVLHNGISTRSAKPGDPVYFETLFPVMVDGRVAIPAGTYISGEVTESKRPGRVKGRAELMVKLTTMILPNAYQVNLNATPGGAAGTGGGETMDKEGKVTGDSDKASDAGTIAKTTAAGAGIGAIASRSASGAGIGAGIGAAVGIGAVLLSRGPEAELPRGSTLDAVINRPILLDADKAQFNSPGQASTLPGPPNREPTRSRVPF
jgi:type IV secretion system protein VirB10